LPGRQEPGIFLGNGVGGGRGEDATHTVREAPKLSFARQSDLYARTFELTH